MFALENADKLFHFLDRLKPYKIMSLFFGGASFCWLFFFSHVLFLFAVWILRALHLSYIFELFYPKLCINIFFNKCWPS